MHLLQDKVDLPEKYREAIHEGARKKKMVDFWNFQNFRNFRNFQNFRNFPRISGGKFGGFFKVSGCNRL